MGLDALDLGEFENSASEIAAAIVDDPGNLVVLVSGGIDALNAASLDPEEVHRRTRRFIEVLPTSLSVQRALAEAGRSAGPEVRAAIVAEIPGAFRQLLYSSSGSAEATPVGEERPAPPTDEADVKIATNDDANTVLLLGDRQDVEANTRFLESRGFAAISISHVDRLHALSGERFCGVVVYRSWRSKIASGELFEFLEERLDSANLVYYRIDVSDLGLDESLRLQSLRGKYDAHVKGNVVLADGCTLTDADIVELNRVAGMLSSCEQTGLTVEGLSAKDRRALIAAVATFEAEMRRSDITEPLEMTVGPLTAGRSGAQVYRVAVQGGRAVVIAKLDEISKLNAEMEKARAMMPNEQILQMAVYSLEGVAVLVQQLVADADHASKAAPSLRERLELLAAVEGGRQHVVAPDADGLIVGLKRVFTTIGTMNASAPGDALDECWTGTEPISALAEEGIRWTLEAGDGEFDVREPLDVVAELLEAFDHEATVHGDLHAGNVLLPDDRVPQLIDFARAGAGHPAFDFVRLSSAVAYACIRCLTPETEVRAYFEALHLTSKSAEELRSEFPRIVAGSLAGVANNALTLARDASIAALPAGDEGMAQYLAMVYLVGVQSLTRPEFQAGIVRAALGAIKPRLLPIP